MLRLTLKINKLNCLWDNNRKSEAFVEKWEGELKLPKYFKTVRTCIDSEETKAKRGEVEAKMKMIGEVLS